MNHEGSVASGEYFIPISVFKLYNTLMNDLKIHEEILF